MFAFTDNDGFLSTLKEHQTEQCDAKNLQEQRSQDRTIIVNSTTSRGTGRGGADIDESWCQILQVLPRTAINQEYTVETEPSFPNRLGKREDGIDNRQHPFVIRKRDFDVDVNKCQTLPFRYESNLNANDMEVMCIADSELPLVAPPIGKAQLPLQAHIAEKVEHETDNPHELLCSERRNSKDLVFQKSQLLPTPSGSQIDRECTARTKQQCSPNIVVNKPNVDNNPRHTTSQQKEDSDDNLDKEWMLPELDNTDNCHFLFRNVGYKSQQLPLNHRTENDWTNTKNPLELTALHADDAGTRESLYMAVIYRDADTVGSILDALKAQNIHFEDGKVLLCAANSGFNEIVKMILMSGIDVNYCEEGYTPLIEAALGGHSDVIQMLLQAGGNHSDADSDGKTALLVASMNGHLDAVDILIRANANVHQSDETGKTPLHYAAAEGYIQIAMLLLKAGSRIDEPDIHFRTPLLLAAANKHPEVVRDLLEAGSDVHHCDEAHQTALHMASSAGSTETVHVLLKHGANVHHIDQFGMNAATLADCKGYQHTAQYLYEAGACADLCPRGFGRGSRSMEASHENTIKDTNKV